MKVAWPLFAIELSWPRDWTFKEKALALSPWILNSGLIGIELEVAAFLID